MAKIRSLLAGCAGAILLAATLCVYFLADFAKTDVTGWALGTVLFSEAVLFGGAAALRRLPAGFSPVLARAGLSTVLGLYFAATVVCACLAGLFGRHLNRFVLVSVLLFAAAALAAVLLLYFAARTDRAGRSGNAGPAMEQASGTLGRLAAEFGGEPYGARLRELCEEARLAGQPGAQQPAGEILSLTAGLEQALGQADTPREDIEQAMGRLQAALARPDIGRRGGF